MVWQAGVVATEKARVQRTTPAQAALLAWIEETEQTRVGLARRLGVHHQLVRQWLKGTRRPSIDMAVALEDISEGSVEASAWADPKEVAEVVVAAAEPEAEESD